MMLSAPWLLPADSWLHKLQFGRNCPRIADKNPQHGGPQYTFASNFIISWCITYLRCYKLTDVWLVQPNHRLCHIISWSFAWIELDWIWFPMHNKVLVGFSQNQLLLVVFLNIDKSELIKWDDMSIFILSMVFWHCFLHYI